MSDVTVVHEEEERGGGREVLEPLTVPLLPLQPPSPLHFLIMALWLSNLHLF